MVYSAPELRNGKAQSGQRSKFGAKFLSFATLAGRRFKVFGLPAPKVLKIGI
jgi:hypothetical protein